MNNQQQSHHYQHKYQRTYQRQQQPQGRQQSGNPLERRREFLWRERVKLEMQAQALTERAESIEQEWRALQHRKASLQQQKPKLAVQILLSGLAGTRYLPAERLYHYERERLMQEEERLQQAMIWCQNDLAALQAQIEVIRLELSFLS
jgi:seryl-tRNA synthetase